MKKKAFLLTFLLFSGISLRSMWEDEPSPPKKTVGSWLWNAGASAVGGLRQAAGGLVEGVTDWGSRRVRTAVQSVTALKGVPDDAVLILSGSTAKVGIEAALERYIKTAVWLSADEVFNVYVVLGGVSAAYALEDEYGAQSKEYQERLVRDFGPITRRILADRGPDNVPRILSGYANIWADADLLRHHKIERTFFSHFITNLDQGIALARGEGAQAERPAMGISKVRLVWIKDTNTMLQNIFKEQGEKTPAELWAQEGNPLGLAYPYYYFRVRDEKDGNRVLRFDEPAH